MSQPANVSNNAPVNFPPLNVLSVERIGQPEQGKLSKAFNAFLQAVSKAFSVATPKLHALVTTNFEDAKDANLAINTGVLNEVEYNNLIDAAIKTLDLKDGEEGYKTPTDLFNELSDSIFRLDPSLHSKFNSVFKNNGSNVDGLTTEQIKTRLLTAKINAQSFPGGVVGLTNVAESLTRTALQSKKVEWTNLRTELDAVRIERDLKINSATSEYQADYDLLAQLEELLRKLSSIDDRTSSADIDHYFQQFVGHKGDMEELYATRHDLAESDKALLDKLNGSLESKILFYNDLQKPDSDYLRILLSSVGFQRRKLNEKASPLNLANREMRSEKFDEMNLRFIPTAGIIFRDIFNKFNNFTCEWALVSKPISWLKESLIDRSKSSVCATAVIVAGVVLYVTYQSVKAIFALGAALTAYVACSIFWAVVVGARFVIGQGIDKLKDHFQKKNQVRNNSKELQGEINRQTRPNELLAGLRTTDFYQAYEAKLEAAAANMQALSRGNIARQALKAKKEAATRLSAVLKRAPMRAEYQEQIAEAARIQQEGQAGDEWVASAQKAFRAVAKRQLLNEALQRGCTLSASIQESERVVEVALPNLESMFRSVGVVGGGNAPREAVQASHHQNLFRSARNENKPAWMDGKCSLGGYAEV